MLDPRPVQPEHTLVEIDARAHRRLDPLLVDVDIRLQKWATWARPFYAAQGFPIAVGVEPGARASTSSGRVAWPAPIVATDAAVGRLHWRLGAAVLAHYLNLGLALEHRAQVYVALSQFLSTRSTTKLQQPARLPTAVTFREDLDRARWSLRHALGA
jgi:hypothetical protein